MRRRKAKQRTDTPSEDKQGIAAIAEWWPGHSIAWRSQAESRTTVNINHAFDQVFAILSTFSKVWQSITLEAALENSKRIGRVVSDKVIETLLNIRTNDALAVAEPSVFLNDDTRDFAAEANRIGALSRSKSIARTMTTGYTWAQHLEVIGEHDIAKTALTVLKEAQVLVDLLPQVSGIQGPRLIGRFGSQIKALELAAKHSPMPERSFRQVASELRKLTGIAREILGRATVETVDDEDDVVDDAVPELDTASVC